MYRTEADELDRELLATMRAWSDAAFNYLALRVFEHQLKYNKPYADYCGARGVTPDAMPEDWEGIVPIPSAAFKEAALATFDPYQAQLSFETSGTTRGETGTHYMETSALYDASLLAGFKRFMLRDGMRLHFFNLVPNPRENRHSSLGYMMGMVSQKFGRSSHWFLRDGAINVGDFVDTLAPIVERGEPVCIATTAFALVHLLDALEARGLTFLLPAGSRIMETGGFKGRSRIVERGELYERASHALGIAQQRIIAEYGMTELASQYYDDAKSLGASEIRYKVSPPWLRARVVAPDGFTVPEGTVGSLVHVDIANRSSCVAIATEDLGVRYGERFVLLGREQGARLRGCSLSAEELLAQ